MVHPYGNVTSQRSKASGVLQRAGYSRGGSAPKAEAKSAPKKLAAGGNPMSSAGRKSTPPGGIVAEFAPKKRLDKYARGGRAKHHKVNTKINIIIPQGGGGPPMPMPMPPMAAGPQGPMPGPGGMPGMSNRGGRYAKGGAVKKANGGPVTLRKIESARGDTGTKMDAGAGGGEGRLEKIRAYGAKPKGGNAR